MLIGIAGAAGSGKDTLADHLAKVFEAERYSFAQPIKSAVREIFGWDSDHTDGKLKDVVDPIYNVSPRVAMQKLGTEYGRNMINKNLWLLRAEGFISEHGRVIISDVRFDNEAKLIRDMGGIVLRIERKDTLKVASHVSESGINTKYVSATIVNNKKLDNLFNSGERIIRGYFDD